MHRHELDRGDAELAKMPDDRGMRDRGVRAAKWLRNFRMQHRETANVRFVENGSMNGRPGRLVAFPVELRIDHDRARSTELWILGRLEIRFAELESKAAAIPALFAVECLCIRIAHDDVRIEAKPPRRLVRSLDAEAIPLAGGDARNITVPDEA